MSVRTCRRASIAAVALTALVAAPASAHPFIAGGELPVDSLATMTLTMAHGCGGDDGGEEEPTTEVALEVPEWLRVVEVADVPGYVSEIETDNQGRAQTVVWTAESEGEPAPAFDLDVVASGEVGAERYLPVFQGCENGSYRWIGTPDEPADDPAVRVTLAAADPAAPPPPVEEAPTPEPTVTDAPEQAGSTDTETPDGAAATDAPTATSTDAPAATVAAEDEGGNGGTTAAVVAALLVIGIGATMAIRRRNGSPDA